MKYDLVLNMRDKHFNLLRTSVVIVLDTERDMSCDVGIAIADAEQWLVSQVRDISVTLREHKE
jgi:hypothetical protein